MAGCAFVVHLDGWRDFCRESQIDESFILSQFPASQHFAYTESPARLFAFTKAEAEAYMKSKGRTGCIKTPATVKEGLQVYMEARMAL